MFDKTNGILVNWNALMFTVIFQSISRFVGPMLIDHEVTTFIFWTFIPCTLYFHFQVEHLFSIFNFTGFPNLPFKCTSFVHIHAFPFWTSHSHFWLILPIFPYKVLHSKSRSHTHVHNRNSQCVCASFLGSWFKVLGLGYELNTQAKATQDRGKMQQMTTNHVQSSIITGLNINHYTYML